VEVVAGEPGCLQGAVEGLGDLLDDGPVRTPAGGGDLVDADGAAGDVGDGGPDVLGGDVEAGGVGGGRIEGVELGVGSGAALAASRRARSWEAVGLDRPVSLPIRVRERVPCSRRRSRAARSFMARSTRGVPGVSEVPAIRVATCQSLLGRFPIGARKLVAPGTRRQATTTPLWRRLRRDRDVRT
jgi:hypothetical protein